VGEPEGWMPLKTIFLSFAICKKHLRIALILKNHRYIILDLPRKGNIRLVPRGWE